MVAIKVPVTIPFNTGLPEDVAVNVWSFEIADDTSGNFDQIEAAMTDFYTNIAGRLSPALDLELIRLQIYVRSDTAPAPPRVDTTIDCGTTNTSGPLPEEVSICMSFKGASLPGAIPARRRGRLYLGPLGDVCVEAGLYNQSKVLPAVVSSIDAAYTAMDGELTTAGNFHTVWSQVSSTNVPVTDVWVDNAFDTQRRRGVAASARSTIWP